MRDLHHIWLHSVIIVLLVFTLPEPGILSGGSTAPGTGDALVLADPSDPYYALAEEIAQQEALTIVHTLEDVIARAPTFLLWVVSPPRLSDEIMVEFSLAIRDHPQAIAMGIISGSTVDKARALWLRAFEAQAQRAYAVNAPNPSTNIFEGRISAAHQAGQVQPLTLTNLRDVLGRAEYVTFTGHGGAGYWRLDENHVLRSPDVPALSPVIVSSGACQTFRPWRAGSIALRFVDQGAAAYTGFIYSPNEGYLLGAYDGLPFRYTWPGVPIGLVMQVQNRGTLRGFAKIPYYHLLGDPRIALRQDAPYRVLEDTVKGNTRRIRYAGAPAGVIPLRIPDGAAYRFVKVPGETAAAESDLFYNSRLQMMNLGEEKIILFEHHGGDLLLHLRARAPALWAISDGLLDVQDHALIFNTQAGSEITLLILGGLAALLAGWRAWRRRLPARGLISAVSIALALTGLHGLYAFVRQDHVTITSKTLTLPPLALVATFLLVGSGALLYLAARSRWRRMFSVIVACSPLLLGMAATFLVSASVNGPIYRQFGVGIWNYALPTLNAFAFLLQSLILAFAFAPFSRPWGSQTHARRSPPPAS